MQRGSRKLLTLPEKRFVESPDLRWTGHQREVALCNAICVKLNRFQHQTVAKTVLSPKPWSPYLALVRQSSPAQSGVHTGPGKTLPAAWQKLWSSTHWILWRHQRHCCAPASHCEAYPRWQGQAGRPLHPHQVC